MNRRTFIKLTGITTLVPSLSIEFTQAETKQILNWKKYNGIAYHQVSLMSYYGEMYWISHSIEKIKNWKEPAFNFTKVKFKCFFDSFIDMPLNSKYIGYTEDWVDKHKYIDRTIYKNNIEQMYCIPMVDIRDSKFIPITEKQPKINKLIIGKTISHNRPFEFCYSPLIRKYNNTYRQEAGFWPFNRLIDKKDMKYISWIYLPKFPKEKIVE